MIFPSHKQKKGNLRHALYCLLACVRGLKDGSHFQQLPECLHNVSVCDPIPYQISNLESSITDKYKN